MFSGFILFLEEAALPITGFQGTLRSPKNISPCVFQLPLVDFSYLPPRRPHSELIRRARRRQCSVSITIFFVPLSEFFSSHFPTLVTSCRWPASFYFPTGADLHLWFNSWEETKPKTSPSGQQASPHLDLIPSRAPPLRPATSWQYGVNERAHFGPAPEGIQSCLQLLAMVPSPRAHKIDGL